MQETIQEFMGRTDELRRRFHAILLKKDLPFSKSHAHIGISYSTVRKFFIQLKPIQWRSLVLIERWIEECEREFTAHG